jgi:NAD dependent epimerase/dehydratase family enzyme
VALKLALGELSQLLLSSQRVVPQVARRAGYSLRHAELGSALADCLAR